MVEVGIIGGTGYTAGELIRLMIHHPKVNIRNIVSRSSPGTYLHLIHSDLLGDVNNIKFSNEIKNDELDIIFLCSGHGRSKKELFNISDKIKVIDLSQDFRMIENSTFKKRNFIYGLPELQKNIIRQSDNIANPGCFATSIILSILPLAKNNLLKKNIHISAITGSTGSGKEHSETSHFSWRNNNISAYKIFTHQHLCEIEQIINKVQNNFVSKIYFVPYRGNFTRGIISTTYTETDISLEDNNTIYKKYYNDHPFVHISDINVDVKQVVNTNKCILYITKEKNKLIIISIIDNLIKGASGQAIQNMNLMFNIEETCGLILKSIRF
ncbi:N-acetyl-gamma-glutamyl-phosphate reductase [Blattabacterium cuenoti]|uniref:N-acetyl-gamma-glutamyl-phosphate reductase n=1 Tax=Blattabacterium cuenoti TaxID=1653831 RepID=UPI00163C8B0E|nr:N-acetyl-gamma-glutamyl-phosphate reductase [Blattabacterium cuenoti]